MALHINCPRCGSCHPLGRNTNMANYMCSKCRLAERMRKENERKNTLAEDLVLGTNSQETDT